jgi:hypothetical protein
MKTCPFCAEQIPAESKVCKFCSSTLVRKCPFCAEEIEAGSRLCRFCRSELPAAATSPAATAPPAGPVGEERGILPLILLTFLTCGIYGLVLLYKMGDELNAHQGKNRIRPGVDLLLMIVTCGIWGIWLMYKYPRTLQEITADEKRPVVDITVPCLLLTLLAGFPGWLTALAILQSELNKHWESHRAAGV